MIQSIAYIMDNTYMCVLRPYLKILTLICFIPSIFNACYDISDDLLAEDENLLINEAGTSAGASAGTSAGTNAGNQIVVNPDMRMGYNPDNGCQIGSSLGLCSVCGPSQTAIKPPNDENCPRVDCQSLATYEVRNLDDGGKVCEYYPFAQTGDNCEVQGLCVENPQLICTAQPMEEILEWRPGCGTFEGCEGTTPPSTTYEVEGTLCYEFGTCNQIGQCSVHESCYGLDYVDGNEHCSSDQNGCKVYASARNYNAAIQRLNCQQYCFRGRGGKGCVDGWVANGACQEGENIGCNEERENVICLCEP